MEVDNITYKDLSIFDSEDEFSILSKLDFTITVEGKEWLYRFFKNPLSDVKQINDIQKIIKLIIQRFEQWPSSISNGTVMVVDRFYSSNIDSFPANPNFLNALSYKVIHSADFSLVKYSLKHFADFLRGMRNLVELLSQED